MDGKLLKKLTEQMDDRFHTTAHLDVYMVDQAGKSVAFLEHDATVPVEFNMDFEYREWGVKSVYLSIAKPIQFEYWIEDDEGKEGEHKTVEVDLSDATIDWSEAGAYTVDGIVIDLNADGTVKKATVNATYLRP